MNKVEMYRSEDGKLFESQERCMSHEIKEYVTKSLSYKEVGDGFAILKERHDEVFEWLMLNGGLLIGLLNSYEECLKNEELIWFQK